MKPVFAALLISLLFNSLPAKAGSLPQIKSAYSAGQDYLVEFEPEPTLFPSGNTLFFGNQKHLYQIEITSRSTHPETGAMSLTNYYDPAALNSTGELNFQNGTGLELICTNRLIQFRSVNETARAALQKQITSKNLKITFLPSIRIPLYFFQVQGKPEYILITEPKFNFHGDYEVLMGPLGRLKHIPTDPVPAPSRDRPAGTIRFQAGGGVYVPMSIDLFSAAAEQRGSPTLLRTGNSPIENLVRPKLKKADQSKFALRTPKIPRIPTPCGQK